MRQKPRRSESARELRTELYVQVTIITTISNHRYSRDGGYRGESKHESSPTTPTAVTGLTAEPAAAAAAPPTRLWPPPPPPPPPTTTTTPETTTGPAVKWRLGDYDEPGQPLFRHYREIFSAPSSRSIQSGSIAPPSHTAAASLRRRFGYTPRVRDTNTASATHNEQTNNAATHLAADRRSGCSTCKQSQQPTPVDQSETRQVSDLAPAPPPSWPVGVVEAENNRCTVTFNSDSEAREEVVVVTGDTCSPEDSGSTPVSGRRYEHEFWLCRR